MEREVGGGIGIGNTCKPMADSFQCMTKRTTIKKKKLLGRGQAQGCIVQQGIWPIFCISYKWKVIFKTYIK